MTRFQDVCRRFFDFLGRGRLNSKLKTPSTTSHRCRVEPLEDRRLLSVSPVMATIDDVTMGSGTAYYVNLEATDPDVLADGSGERLTYSVSYDSVSELETLIPAGENNRSLRINVDSPGNGISGSMEFQLFEELAPAATDRIISLAESGFYDDIIFHRVIDEFMIQGGDPGGDGTGGSDLGEFDDEFSPWGMHTTPGILSMAKSNDDTNDSQFFITETPTRWLDFNHTVFGKLTAGENIREAISSVPVDDDDIPEDDVTMTSVEVFTDYEDGVLILRAPEGYTGQVDVTVTVDDGNGGTDHKTFTVTVEEDADPYGDSDPYLDTVAPIKTTVDTPVTVILPAIDVDGGDFYFDAQVYPENEHITLDIDHDSGELTITPSAGIAGNYSIFVGVRQEDGSSWDTQLVPIFIAQMGDLDGNGVIDEGDLEVLSANWGDDVTPGDWAAGDPSGDGRVNSTDLDIVRANWGEQNEPVAASSADSISSDGFVASGDLEIIRRNWGIKLATGHLSSMQTADEGADVELSILGDTGDPTVSGVPNEPGQTNVPGNTAGLDSGSTSVFLVQSDHPQWLDFYNLDPNGLTAWKPPQDSGGGTVLTSLTEVPGNAVLTPWQPYAATSIPAGYLIADTTSYYDVSSGSIWANQWIYAQSGQFYDPTYYFTPAYDPTGNSIYMTPTLEGDLDSDGAVGLGDMRLLQESWCPQPTKISGGVVSVSPIVLNADVSHDGVIDSQDLDLVRANLGRKRLGEGQWAPLGSWITVGLDS